MWLFKKKAVSSQAPVVPRFPGAPAEQPSVPDYTQTFQALKQLPKIEMPQVEQQGIISPPPDIPQREPLFVQKRSYPEREARSLGPAQLIEKVGKARPVEERDEHGLPQRVAQGLAFREQDSGKFPSLKETRSMQAPAAEADEQRQNVNDDKPVFVKLEQYRDVVSNIEILKQKIKETEYLLERIEELRGQEQVELDNCHGTMNKLKEKLIAIDKKLFEV